MTEAESYAAELAEYRREWAMRCLEHVFALCESPIEEKMLRALLAWSMAFPNGFGDAHMMFHDGIGGVTSWMTRAEAHADAAWIVTPQAPVLTYRADFLVESSRVRIVVECDGHDFHERTKAQASHDRRRDRRMQAAGFVVMRFTGSDIHRDVERCASEVWECLAAKGREARGAA